MQNTANQQLVFLTYLRRSGSTYLCQLLSRLTDVSVSLEGTFLDGMTTARFEANTEVMLDSYLDLLYCNHPEESPLLRELSKFRYWNIDRELFKATLLQQLPVRFEQVLQVALRMYFTNSTARIWVYKNGNYIWHIPRLRIMFPDARFIFVMRDPRAIYASQRVALSSNTGKPMCENPLLTAREFRRAASIVQEFSNAPWFHCVSYENLIESPSEEFQQLVTFLNLHQPVLEQSKSYYKSIPFSQKHLHTNVTSEPKPERVSAWKTTLNAGDRAIIEMTSGHYLGRFGYNAHMRAPASFFAAICRFDHWMDIGRRIIQRTCRTRTQQLPVSLQSQNH